MPEKSEPKRFNDFAREARPLEGAKIKIDDIINREIKVTDYKIATANMRRKTARSA